MLCPLKDERSFSLPFGTSPIEDGVFTLEGVRLHLRAKLFPWHADVRGEPERTTKAEAAFDPPRDRCRQRRILRANMPR